MIILRLDDAIAGVERLQRRIMAIHNIGQYAGPLMEHWERIIEADNRRGVLAGTDKDGNPADALLYRPVTPGGKKLTVGQRLGQRPNLRRGRYAGIGDYSQYGILANNNLTTSEYRQRAGPRLAPRGPFSRAITNLATTSWPDDILPGVWYAQGAWVEVVSVKGVHFLPYHFRGEVPGARAYDLRGVRPEGVGEAREALRAWAKLTIRERYNSVA